MQKIFANGKEVASKKVSTTVKERIEDLLIGRMGNEFLKGYIDEVIHEKIITMNIYQSWSITINHNKSYLITDLSSFVLLS